MRFEYVAVLAPLTVIAALVAVIIIEGVPSSSQSEAQQASIRLATKEDDHKVTTHTRPICEDSSLFRAEVDGVMKSCSWIAHKPSERCGTIEGTDNNGNKVLAEAACYKACDTGNCRRNLRLGGTDHDVVDGVVVNLDEKEDLN